MAEVKANQIGLLLNTIEWKETGQQPNEDGELYSTHEGVLEIAGIKLRCYRLNNGQAVIHGDDFHNLFNGFLLREQVIEED